MWVGALLYAGHDPDEFFKELEDIGYKLKGVGSYHECWHFSWACKQNQMRAHTRNN